MATLFAVLLASLFGSLHCAGMCGPLVAFAVGTTERQTITFRIVLQLAYHGGRLGAYALLGAVCGVAGAAVDLGASLAGLHRLAALMAGAMMIAVGLVAGLRHSGVRVPMPPVPTTMQRWVMLGQRAAMGLGPLPRSLSVGLLSALLPCGWLYAFAVIAAGTASPIWGAAIMAAFWVGTVPVLASLGIGVQTLTGTFGRRIPLITAVAIVLIGLYTVIDRLALPTHAFQPNPPDAAQSDTLEQVQAIGQSKPPCCHEQHD